MAFAGTVIGAFLGLTTKLGSNVLQKVPYMRHPWEHVLLIGVGAYAGNVVQTKYAETQQEVEELRLYLERRANTRGE